MKTFDFDSNERHFIYRWLGQACLNLVIKTTGQAFVNQFQENHVSCVLQINHTLSGKLQVKINLHYIDTMHLIRWLPSNSFSYCLCAFGMKGVC